MACLSVKYTRKGEGLTAAFGEVCGPDIGEPYLYDKNGAQLMDKNGAILIAKQ